MAHNRAKSGAKHPNFLRSTGCWRCPAHIVLILRRYIAKIDVTPNLHPVATRASASLLRESAGEARGCVV